VSPFELKTGTVIPGVMIGGINSDLPGQIVAQVRENVWDTATGHHLLIPQGARLVGTYDNQVTRGQSRVLVAWTRIIYPDGSSVDLGTMPGADQGGYAGFSDKVNNHYVRVFGDALLMSLFSAGIQLSQPKSNDSMNGGYSSQQIIAASLGQQLGQAGMQITQRIWTFNQRSKSGRAIAST
jgi:type IV secretion system protein VirB10